MKYEDNPSSIKFYVKRYIFENKEQLKNKTVVDFPAGNGITSRILKEIGATPLAFDLFPEYFQIEGLNCEKADITKGIPIKENTADAIICQEGIEHFSDQLNAMKEFSRILKINGTLLITTPNYSNLRAKLSYLLTESERFNSIMPPNELDSIWMSDQKNSNEIYYGHIFLIGIQKLRLLAKLAGFRIEKIHKTKTKTTSVLLYPFLISKIYLSNLITYRKAIRKNKLYTKETKKKIYKEILSLNINFKILTGSHLMVEFVKESNPDEVGKTLKNQHLEFGTT